MGIPASRPVPHPAIVAVRRQRAASAWQEDTALRRAVDEVAEICGQAPDDLAKEIGLPVVQTLRLDLGQMRNPYGRR